MQQPLIRIGVNSNRTECNGNLLVTGQMCVVVLENFDLVRVKLLKTIFIYYDNCEDQEIPVVISIDRLLSSVWDGRSPSNDIGN